MMISGYIFLAMKSFDVELNPKKSAEIAGMIKSEMPNESVGIVIRALRDGATAAFGHYHKFTPHLVFHWIRQLKMSVNTTASWEN
jgi:hypothetical protein